MEFEYEICFFNINMIIKNTDTSDGFLLITKFIFIMFKISNICKYCLNLTLILKLKEKMLFACLFTLLII